MSQEQETRLISSDEVGREVRRVWHSGEWWYVVVDFIAIWTESYNPGQYWRNMKKRADPDFERFITEHFRAFPFKAPDGRMREFETANQEFLLRLVQSVPSKNAEKVKRLLARWGSEKLEELQQGPSPIEAIRADYRRQGYSDEWIEVRISELLARNQITDVWQERGASETHYPVLTNTLTEQTFGLKVKSYKLFKNIRQGTNLQDNMTPEELAFSVISKSTAKTYHEDRDSQGFEELHRDVYDAGVITGQARKMIEEATGHAIVSPKNAKDLRQLPEKKQKRLSSEAQPSLFNDRSEE